MPKKKPIMRVFGAPLLNQPGMSPCENGVCSIPAKEADVIRWYNEHIGEREHTKEVKDAD